jgi:hypothetical protein
MGYHAAQYGQSSSLNSLFWGLKANPVPSWLAPGTRRGHGPNFQEFGNLTETFGNGPHACAPVTLGTRVATMLQSMRAIREMRMQSQREQRRELDRWSDEGGSQTEVVNPDPDSNSPARNDSDTNRPDRQSQTQQSSKSHKQTA